LLRRGEELAAARTGVAARLGEEVGAYAAPVVPHALELLPSSPGVGQGTAQTFGAASGVARSRFASANHWASWAGGWPGKHESAGQRQSGHPPKGNKAVRTL
jgi:transposase